jgi:TDG/mug DNA glycosylase family protein
MSSCGAVSISKSQTRISGFSPIVGNYPRVLILGSMPGIASLEVQEYYALPRNTFWPIMGELFGAHFDMAYSRRLDILSACHVALWDVLGSCIRPGSLDASIDTRSVTVNNFARLFSQYPTIRQVFFNGQKAAEMYRRHVRPMLDEAAAGIPCSTLPSTSPAHASLPFGEKLVAWGVVRDAAGRS